ncbi:hypothetical protein PSTT_04193 [Puccinia striiformis]|uniref:Uncharacterized protein n=1 Tax=Puccinia striiformis TaxID=27350 RepID=A0A2S4VTU1_9BASI|nr:hypothetical protein PSTT_04193 [Puccinia striiformis]
MGRISHNHNWPTGHTSDFQDEPTPRGPNELEDPNLAPDHDAVYSRYAELHPLDEDPRDSVSRLLRETSLIRVEQYLDRLAEAFGQLPNAFGLRSFINTRDGLLQSTRSLRQKCFEALAAASLAVGGASKSFTIRIPDPEHVSALKQEFFSGQTGDHDEKQRLSEWHDYNFQSGGDLATRVRDTMKQFGQEESEASKAFQEKLEKLEFSTRFISNPELKVMLAFDEARALIALESNDDQTLSYFGALRRILSKIPPNMKVFTVFTDTTSHVSNFCPTLCNDSSARPPPDSLELYPPIYAIGTFDSKVPPSRPKTWNDLLSPPRLFSYVKEPPNSLTSEVIVANVSKMAIGKLLCIPLRLDALTEGQKFALLGCTIQPQIHEASKLNSELVSSHMAQCLYISPTRERFISEYPSQFTLSMAANNFLAEHDSRLIACIKALTSVMQQGLISSGNSGELVSRIILLRAMQKAMLNSPIRTKQTHIPYGCPKWDSQFAGVGLEDSIPYLIICFSFKTIRTDYTLPQIPQRGSLIFHGLDNFGCLTPEIIVALKELLLAEPDVRQYHKDNELITRFVETSRPNFYPVGELSDSDEGMVDPDDQTS